MHSGMFRMLGVGSYHKLKIGIYTDLIIQQDFELSNFFYRESAHQTNVEWDRKLKYYLLLKGFMIFL